MTERITRLRPHVRHGCFAVVQCGNRWKLQLLVDDVIVRQEPIPSSFAEALLDGVGCAEG
jgi:hypothetical protein